jgi:NitT/TauT family transport system permease protein
VLQRAGWFFLSLGALIAIWAVAAFLAQSRLLPSPAAVLALGIEEARSGELARHVLATLGRVVAAFVLAMFIGGAIGLALGLKAKANRFFDPWLVVALNIPALVTIVLCYLWIGLNEVAAVAAVAINKIPNVAVTIREGARAMEPQYDDVAKVYRFSFASRMRDIVWPQLEPFVAASVRSGLALIWKIVLVVELLGRSNGVGFQLNLFFQNFEMGRLLAYAISFMIIVQLIEFLLIKPWERNARRWRGEAPYAL